VCFGWVSFWLGINDKVIISALIVIYSFYHAVYRNTCEKPDIQATCETQQNLLNANILNMPAKRKGKQSKATEPSKPKRRRSAVRIEAEALSEDSNARSGSDSKQVLLEDMEAIGYVYHFGI
jgi:hypothetical protein